ncbi:MAG TPA: dihydrodipicolinate synthase family protein [Cellulomonas sp.]
MALFGALVAYPPTPRDADGRVAPDLLADLVERAVGAGVSGVTVLGSTGGFAYLGRAERRLVVDTAVRAADGRVPVMAGVGALTTEAVLAHTADAREAGATAVLVPTMSYLPLTDDEVLGLVRDVAAVAEVPVWAYHNPGTTGFDYSVDLLARVAALPGVGGVKDRGRDLTDLRERVAALSVLLPAEVELGFSGDVLGAEALIAGARTWHTGLGGVLPEWYVAVARAATGGRADRARVLMERLGAFAALVMAHGGPRAVHAVAALRGLDVGALPAPLLAPADGAVAELAQGLDLLGDAPTG